MMNGPARRAVGAVAHLQTLHELVLLILAQSTLAVLAFNLASFVLSFR